MSDKSPLFVSAIELLAHASELYIQGNERKFKFVILHLANSIELVLKDRLIDKGISIYIPKKSQTISVWNAFDELKKVHVDIVERPVIELLIDDRNTIQHRFGFPDSETVYFYLEHIVTFFQRFLDEEYNVDLVEVLSPYLSNDDLAILGLIEIDEEDAYTALDKLYELSPESAVLQAYTFVEGKFLDAMGIDLSTRKRPPIFWREPDFLHLLDDLAIDGFINQEAVKNFGVLRDMRNRAAHFHGDTSSQDWKGALDIAKDLLMGLEKALQENYFSERNMRKHKINTDEAPEESNLVGQDCVSE